ncbi:MAG: hypothetical protein JRI35_08735, partial [Deltaproteobacteria bacterium]|nr:hypothetical protein [Deltaproteobacteria bacterium]
MNPWSRVTVHGRGYFFSLHTSAPCFLEAFDMGDVLPPLHSPYAALKAMQFPPQQKPGKLRGLPL